MMDKEILNLERRLYIAEAEIERLRPYKAELLKIAATMGEPNDPFAVWEKLRLLTYG